MRAGPFAQQPGERAGAGEPRSRATEEDPRIRRPMLSLPDRTLPDLPMPEPAGPLRTFAQVPTELMQELTRLRSAEQPTNAAGVPGRRDPTPVPAPADAIAPRGTERAVERTDDVEAGSAAQNG